MKNTSNPLPKKTPEQPYWETSVSPDLSGRGVPAWPSASLGAMWRCVLRELPSRGCSPCSLEVCSSICRVLPGNEKAGSSAKHFSSLREPMAEFLRNSVKSQNEDSQTLVQPIAPICVQEEGTRTKGCSSRCALSADPCCFTSLQTPLKDCSGLA